MVGVGVEECLKEGSHCFSPQHITWKGHSSALAMSAPACESPPSHLGEALARNDLLQMPPSLSI